MIFTTKRKIKEIHRLLDRTTRFGDESELFIEILHERTETDDNPYTRNIL